MLTEAIGTTIDTGRSLVGFENNQIFSGEKPKWEWNPKKALRNALLAVLAYGAYDTTPKVYNAIDMATAPSSSEPKTLLEAQMDGEIRKGNLLSLLLVFNNHPPADQLLGDKSATKEYSIAPEYPFADGYIQGRPDQTVYLLEAFKQTNLGAIQVTKARELYVLTDSGLVDRYQIKDTTNVTRINGDVANEYFIVQPYYDDTKNISTPDKKSMPGDLKIRFLAVGRWDNTTNDVDWGDEEINAIWKSLPTSGTLTPGNLPDLSGIIGVPNQVIPLIFPGIQGQETFRDRVTKLIGTIKPFHQTENLQSPLEFINKPKIPTPESSLIKNGVPVKGRSGSFGNTGLPKSEVLRRQKLG